MTTGTQIRTYESINGLMARVIKTPTCWIWTGARNNRGYGCISIDGTSQLVHRLVYKALVGPLDDFLTVDHVKARGCTSKVCVNPDHLEAVTRQVNSQRQAENITHCSAGHQLTKKPGDRQRRCRVCENDRRKAARAAA